VVKNSPRVIPETAERIINLRLPKTLPHWRSAKMRNRAIDPVALRGSCDCDDGEVYFYIVANCLAHPTLVANVGRPNPISLVYALLRKWAEKWVPKVAADKIDSVIARAIAKPRRWRADTAAKL
jgi:hypothetical protein